MPYPVELIQSIADRHGLSGDLSLLPKGGMVNEAWSIGDTHILRIVAEGGDAECDTEVAREGAVVPLLVAAGMRTPRLIAADMEFAPRPYTIYERAGGELLGFCKLPHERFESAYPQIGRELALLHRVAIPDAVLPSLRTDLPINVPMWVGRSLEAGAISQQDADDIAETAARWIEIGGPMPALRLIHNDVHPWNLMCDTATCALTAIIDWGDATLGDPARDFAAMPLSCVPAMLEGYSELWSGPPDLHDRELWSGPPDLHDRELWCGSPDLRAFVARSLVVGLNVALWEVRAADIMTPERHWWRMPPGGWSEMKSLVAQYWPGLMA